MDTVLRFSSPDVSKMTTDEVMGRLEIDPDFVYLKRFNYSLRKLMLRYPDGCPTKVIAQALLVTEEDVEQLYSSAVEKMRNLMGV